MKASGLGELLNLFKIQFLSAKQNNTFLKL